MPINSRQKGCRGEREVRDLFREQGYEQARRGQQFSGSPDSPDVIIPELPWLHIESKWVQSLNIQDAMDQAVRDAGGKAPVVFHKKNGTEWLVTMKPKEFFWLVKAFEKLKEKTKDATVGPSEAITQSFNEPPAQ